MEYRAGHIGRVFTIRFDHGDDFLGGMETLVRKENLRSGWFHVLGGLRQAEVVIGPREPVMPPDPVWHEVDGAREVLGFGTVFWDNEEPKIHLHAALGDHGDALVACVRRNTRVYLILEVFLIEVSGPVCGRPWYGEGGFSRLSFAD